MSSATLKALVDASGLTVVDACSLLARLRDLGWRLTPRPLPAMLPPGMVPERIRLDRPAVA